MKHFFAACFAMMIALPCAADVMSQSAFTKDFAKALRAKHPDYAITIAGELELSIKPKVGDGSTMYLDNAYREYAADPGSKAAIIAKFGAALLATRADEEKAEPSQIVPVVKDKAWIEETNVAIRKAGKGKEPPDYVFDELNPELIVMYAIDTAETIRYLTRADLEELALDRSRLRDIAVENLRRLLPKVEVKEGKVVSMITAGGTYEASLLLLDEVWSGGKLGVAGDPVVAIPARDLLIFTGSQNPEGIERLRALATEYASQSSYRLTDQLFVFRNGKLQRFDLH